MEWIFKEINTINKINSTKDLNINNSIINNHIIAICPNNKCLLNKLKNSEKQKYVKALWKENAQEKIVVMHILNKN